MAEETARLAEVARLHAADAPPEPALHRLVCLASRLFGAPVALLSLIDAEQEWIVAGVGHDGDAIPRAASICARTVMADRVLVVADLHADPGFRDNPLLRGAGRSCRYVGAPVISRCGYRIGALAVIQRGGTTRAEQLAWLEDLAAVAAESLEKAAALRQAQEASQSLRARITELEFAHSMLEEQAVSLVALAEDREELYQSNKRQHGFIETLLDTVPIPIFARDASQRLTHANPAYAALVGTDRTALQGLTLAEVVGPAALPVVEEEDRALLADPTGRRTIEKRISLGNGRGDRDVVLHKAVIRADDGKHLGVVGAIVDVTEAKALQARLEQVAATDPLTGVANRRAFMDRALAEAKRSARNAAPLSLIMLDVDRFKSVNDVYGHQAGDEVLKRVAAVCKGATRDPVDLFARLGGEEFVVLLPETDIAAAARVAERLRRAVADARIAHDGIVISVTASFGVAAVELADGGGAVDEALKRADARLYRAKQAGRNQVTADDAPTAAGSAGRS